MPLYTKTGDHGETGLFGNRRVPKDHPRIRAYGTVDELNCFLGLLRAEGLEEDFDRDLEEIQNTLFEVGADLAAEGGSASVARVREAIAAAEGWIDRSEGELPRLRSFVLPAGSRVTALLHVGRAVARRAEREFWTLHRSVLGSPHEVPEVLGVYLNRLSDLFFSWARRANHRAGITDRPWTKPSEPGT